MTVQVFKATPGAPKTGRPRTYPLHTMQVGEGFFVANRSVRVLSSNIHSQGRKLGRKFTLRAEERVLTSDGWMPAVGQLATAPRTSGTAVYRVA